MADKFTALVVDDNLDNRSLFSSALKMAGYDISEAEDGEKALAVLGQRTFNLLILDLQMPRIDGVSVLRQLRKDPRHVDMRVVIITANQNMVTGDVDLLVDHVLYKPYDLKAFIALAKRMKDQF